MSGEAKIETKLAKHAVNRNIDLNQKLRGRDAKPGYVEEEATQAAAEVG